MWGLLWFVSFLLNVDHSFDVVVRCAIFTCTKCFLYAGQPQCYCLRKVLYSQPLHNTSVVLQ